MSVTSKHWLIPFIELLADFLNQDLSGSLLSLWAQKRSRSYQDFLARVGRLSSTMYHELSGPSGIATAETLQAEIRGLLRPILTGEGEDLYHGLSALLAALPGETSLQFLPVNKKAAKAAGVAYEPLRPGRKIFEINGTKWAVDSFSAVLNARDYLLSIIEAALKEGELSRLRQCRKCSAFFVAKHTKRKFCPDKSCKVDYFNEQHLATGYVTKNRRDKRRRAAERGRGKSYE